MVAEVAAHPSNEVGVDVLVDGDDNGSAAPAVLTGLGTTVAAAGG
jgi:hypothetical protein